MSELKELKSIELSSFTTILTGIEIIFAIIFSIIISIAIIAFVPEGVSLAIYMIPTIIVSTLMYGTYKNFFEGFLYNTLSKKLKTINIVIKDGKEIAEISTTETAIMCSIIITIEFILLYLVSVFIMPIFLTSIMQTLAMTGQMAVAFTIYQFLSIISQPTTILILIFGIFIISFVFILLGAFIYNIFANTGRGAVVKLSSENNMTVIESIEPLKLAIVSTVVIGILNVIFNIIMLITGYAPITVVESIVSGFIGAFICGFLIAAFYNFLSPMLGKLKLELIDN
ncbi:MAG: hypothetical protein IKF11_11400 [Methanobrevibacter sp.]|nr:hypothetical protein [Methanobrevibacter sp.]